MGFWTNEFLTVPYWLYAALLVQVIFALSISMYFVREVIKGKIYKTFWSERVIKVFVHYDTGNFKRFWFLIPSDEKFIINGCTYKYTDVKVIKPYDFLAKREKGEVYFIVDGKKYKFSNEKQIQGKWDRYPEIHFNYNIPDAFTIKSKLGKEAMSSRQLRDYETNLLWSKLLNIESEKMMILICIIIGIVNLVVTIIILCNINGWITFDNNKTGAEGTAPTK